jgi:hypothetical protein
MTEQDLVRKVEEFMNFINWVKAYRKTFAYVTYLIIAVLSVTCISLLTFILMKILFITSGFRLIYSWGFTPQFILFLFLLPSIFATAIGLLLIKMKTKEVKIEEGTLLLEEGAPAAIKLLIETDWELVLHDVAFMKWVLAIKILAILFFNFLIGLLCFGQIFFLSVILLMAPVRYDLAGLGALVFVIPITVFMSRKNIKEFYYNVKSIDLLIIDLRWLYNELKGARLEA